MCTRQGADLRPLRLYYSVDYNGNSCPWDVQENNGHFQFFGSNYGWQPQESFNAAVDWSPPREWTVGKAQLAKWWGESHEVDCNALLAEADFTTLPRSSRLFVEVPLVVVDLPSPLRSLAQARSLLVLLASHHYFRRSSRCYYDQGFSSSPSSLEPLAFEGLDMRQQRH